MYKRRGEGKGVRRLLGKTKYFLMHQGKGVGVLAFSNMFLKGYPLEAKTAPKN